MNIRQKLTLAFPAAVAVSVGAFGIVSFVVSSTTVEGALRESAAARLDAVRHAKKEAVERYLGIIESQIKTMSSNLAVIEAAKAFRPAFRQYRPATTPSSALTDFYTNVFGPQYADKNGGRQIDTARLLDQLDEVTLALQHRFLADNPHPLGSKHELTDVTDGTTYSRAHSKYHPMLKRFLEEFEFYDIFLVDPDSGHVVYSVFKHLDYATSLNSGPYASSGLGQAFKRANEASAGEVVLTDFDPYLPSFNDPAAFIAAPVFDGANKVGVLVFQMPIDRLNATLTANQTWTSVGLGKTGESILIGRDYRLRSQRRALVEKPESYFAGLRADNVEANIVEEIKSKKTTIGIEEVRTPAVEQALAGQTGSNTFTSRGRRKMASFTPVSVNGIDWVLVSEIDEQEALSELSALRSTLGSWFVTISLLLLAVAGAVGWFVAQSMSAPIQKLSAAMSELSHSNDFSTRVDVTSEDEIGTMAGALNELLSAVDRAIVELTAVTDAIGNGDLTTEMEGDFRGDLSKLKSSLNLAVENLSSVMGTAQHVASNVAHMASDLTSSSGEMATGAHAQSAAAHESLAAMEQTSSMASVNADHAKEATRLATSAAEAADGGREQMRGLSEAMAKIEESSKSIVKVTKVIEEIAFQTNLLAINAAVEAARAGRHGRGFSVVAQEVQNLAARSATAAQETEALVRDASDAVTRGVKGAGATSQALDQIVQNVRSVESLMTEISQASTEQATGVNQVREAMSDVNRSADQSLANSSKLQDSAAKLTAETGRLQQQVGSFMLREAVVDDASSHSPVETPPPPDLPYAPTGRAYNHGTEVDSPRRAWLPRFLRYRYGLVRRSARHHRPRTAYRVDGRNQQPQCHGRSTRGHRFLTSSPPTLSTRQKIQLADHGLGIAVLGIDLPFDSDESIHFIEQMRNKHPELPIVSRNAQGKLRLLTEHSLGDESLDSRLRDVLWKDLYPEWLIQQFESYVVETLEQGFEQSSFPTQMTMKANRGHHEGIVAIIHLVGDQIGGRLAVYSTRAVLDRLAEMLDLPDTNPEERGIDLGGEIANQIAGRFKGDLARRAYPIMLGIPVLVEGRDLFIRFGEGRPSLMVEVTTDAGPVSVELCLGSRMPEPDREVSVDLALDAGECELF